nr:reverse transcriptase domain, reverse transcriptase zinc-binding domain protein [Tanacetum cinerariifolium]
GKLIQKLLHNQKYMGYLVRAYYNISPTKYYKDDSCWSADLKSKATKDIISIRNFMEVVVLNHYVPVRKILPQNLSLFSINNFGDGNSYSSVKAQDDLITFARSDVAPARVLMEALDEFKCGSDLVPSIPKSTGFFCNVVNHVKASILQLMPFEE